MWNRCRLGTRVVPRHLPPSDICRDLAYSSRRYVRLGDSTTAFLEGVRHRRCDLLVPLTASCLSATCGATRRHAGCPFDPGIDPSYLRRHRGALLQPTEKLSAL